MGWIVALVLISALIALGVSFRHPELEEQWREQAEALRERSERR